MFTLEIDTDNAAFDGRSSLDELTQCFKQVLTKLACGKRDGKVMDTNGNTVGRFEWKED